LNYSNYLRITLLTIASLAACSSESVDESFIQENIDFKIIASGDGRIPGVTSRRQIREIGNQAELDEVLTKYGNDTSIVDFSSGQVLQINMQYFIGAPVSVEVESISNYQHYVVANIVYQVPGPFLGCANGRLIYGPYAKMGIFLPRWPTSIGL